MGSSMDTHSYGQISKLPSIRFITVVNITDSIQSYLKTRANTKESVIQQVQTTHLIRIFNARVKLAY